MPTLLKEENTKGFIENNISADEKLIYQDKPHWIIFSKTILWFLLMLFLLIFGPDISIIDVSFYAGIIFYKLLAGIALIAALLTGIISYTAYANSEFGITDRRVISKIGFLKHTTIEILLTRIETINVYQSLLGRIFNYGSIFITGTGSTQDIFHNIPNPIRFRNLIQRELSQTK